MQLPSKQLRQLKRPKQVDGFCVCPQLLSRVQLFVAPWTVAFQSPHPPGKNTGVGCHSLLQGNFPDPEIELKSPALAGGFYTTESTNGFQKKFLLIGWKWGNLDSQSIAFSFQPVWGLHSCEQHTVIFFNPGWGFNICKGGQRIWLRISSKTLRRNW